MAIEEGARGQGPVTGLAPILTRGPSTPGCSDPQILSGPNASSGVKDFSITNLLFPKQIAISVAILALFPEL